MESPSQSVGNGSSNVPSVPSQLSMIHTAKDLKRAEIQGENVPVSDEQLIKAIDRAIKASQGSETELDFSVHKETKQIMVKVLEKETGKVIREIPQEKMLDFVAKLWEMAGIMIDERR
ncbi:flagellar protein FlaG [Paenibacillus hodogayensis]|uniref:Flagellar protein FlaG n=1 Tax=Paenibacillus hodogayensis TaxID=279208 RepID=A0ABV5W8I9_9BACL